MVYRLWLPSEENGRLRKVQCGEYASQAYRDSQKGQATPYIYPLR